MANTVLGVRRVSYNRKTDGKHVEGWELHYAADASEDDESMNGQYARSLYTTRLDFSKLQPGERVKFRYEEDPRWDRPSLVAVDPE